MTSQSPSGIPVLALVILFHYMPLLQFGMSSNQPPTKKQCEEKRKASPVYEKEERNRKWQRLLEVGSQW